MRLELPKDKTLLVLMVMYTYGGGYSIDLAVLSNNRQGSLHIIFQPKG
jgi:hypothetical protein